MPVSVLFVCMGNICRSPTAEGVFRHHVQQAGLEDQITIASAGTHGYHIGVAPDPRSQAAAAKRNYDLSAQRARLVNAKDIEQFDYVLAMDRENLEGLQRMAAPAQRDKPRLCFSNTQTATMCSRCPIPITAKATASKSCWT